MKVERNNCLIITGGEYAPVPEDILPGRDEAAKEYVIACDSGYINAGRLGIEPDVIIGDFDSAPRPEGVDAEIITYPVRKDDTDTMLAVKRAISEGYRRIRIACAMGGRFDHTYANIQAGAYIAGHGGVTALYGADTQIIIFGDKSCEVPGNELCISGFESCALSVFAVSDTARGVCIKGASYEAEDIELKNDDPLGVSNEFEGGDVSISVREGILMVVISKKM